MVTLFIVINTLLLMALLIQRRRREQPCNLQHAASLQRIEGALKNMATQEDVKRLESALTGVKDAAEVIAQDTTALKEELKRANENTNADLSGAIAMAEGIEQRLKGIAGTAIGSDPEDANPAPEPTNESGGVITGDEG